MDKTQALEALSKEQLVELVQIYAKNLMAMDGVWFQAIEREQGMDAAMAYDTAAWERFTASEARRAIAFLGLGENPGLEGLAKALELKATSLASEYHYEFTDESLIFKITKCRIQVARARKGMPYHPCKPVGLVEYAEFARTIDSRISCECLSCFPDITDETCSCAWKFTLES